MAFTLENVVPWGRNLEEYTRMFELSDPDLDGRILGCADGPASFNAELRERGLTVVSVDPIYQFTGRQIRARVEETCPIIMDQLMQNLCDYVWTRFASPEDLRETRLDAMDLFLVDFDRGKDEGRYLAQGLPDLPFPDHTFDLALSSHFLFLYSGQLSADFHCAAIEEMLRVAKEARVFPLLTLEAQPSPHLASVIEHLDQTRRQYEVKTVDYEFQKGGNRMLRIFSG